MIDEWAKSILEDYDAIRPNRIFSQNLNIDLDLAYKISLKYPNFVYQEEIS